MGGIYQTPEHAEILLQQPALTVALRCMEDGKRCLCTAESVYWLNAYAAIVKEQNG